jgi:membrane-associated phospholipid phosphatase
MLQRCLLVVKSCLRASRELGRRVLVTVALVASAGGASAQTVEPRASVIARAQLWQATDVGRMDLKRGPRLPDVLEPGATVRCDFVDRTFDGKSPKFACALPDGDEVKVKFGEANGEVPGEVAATRLLWALGFGADVMYPVRVICRGCPDWVGGETVGPRERLVDPAAIERKMPAGEIPGTPEAWSWPELDLIHEDEGGAPLAHRDALKLLAVFLQHTDSKPEQQRLVCLDEEADGSARCERPFMIMNDVGLTFGRANLVNTPLVGSVNLREWSQTPVWKAGEACVGNLPRSLTGTLKDPVISEDGREFLADLLMQLSDAQLRDMFEAARLDPDGWVAAFKARRQQIVDRRCDVAWPGGISTLFGTGPVRWLQGHASTPLTAVMNSISAFGYTRVYVAIAVALAFLVRLRAGAALLLLLALNGVLTDGAKAIVSAPRPDAVDSRVQTLDFIATLGESFSSDSPSPSVDADDGYGFPSGHVAATTAFLFGLMYLFQWPWVWRAMVFWIPAMALARLYLGRHFLGDVLGGVGVGVIAATIGFLALTLARLSKPSLAWTAVARTVVAAAACTGLAFMVGVPAAYDAGRFLGLAVGAACVVAYVGPRFAPASDIAPGARVASVGIAAIVFGVSWWGARVLVDAAGIAATPLGGVLAGGLPMLVVLPLPLYLTDRFVIGRAHRASPQVGA